MSSRNRKKVNKGKAPAKDHDDGDFDFDSKIDDKNETNARSKKRSKKGPKTMGQKIAGVVRVVTSLACVLAVLARADVITAFGTGTGFNKAHVSPLAVASSYFLNPDSNPFDKKEYPRLYIASKKICYNLAFAGETIADYLPQLFPLSSKGSTGRKSKKKSSKKKENEMGKKKAQTDSKSAYSRARAWADSQNERNMNILLYNNTPLLVGAGLCIVGAFLSLLFFNEGTTAFLCGGLLMYTGGSSHPGCQVTTLAMYAGGLLLVAIYANDTLMGW